MLDLTSFTQAELTAAINKFPRQWGRVTELGIFKDRGTRTPNIVIEDRDGTLGLLPSHAWGGEGTVAGVDTRHTYSFMIPQTVHEDFLMPSDLVGVRAFGTEGLATMAQEMALRLQRLRSKHDITLEHKRVNALKGRVLNADGTSVLADMFTTFGVTQKVISFDLSSASTKIGDKCAELINHLEDNLMGDVMSGVRVLVSPEFFSALINHASIKDILRYNLERTKQMGTDLRKGFEVYGVVFEEYRGGVNGNKFISANEGHAYPEGTNDTFVTYFAPADFNETVNQLGQAIYVKTWEKEGNRGVTIHSQCNSLPLCHQPNVLVKVTA